MYKFEIMDENEELLKRFHEEFENDAISELNKILESQQENGTIVLVSKDGYSLKRLMYACGEWHEIDDMYSDIDRIKKMYK